MIVALLRQKLNVNIVEENALAQLGETERQD